MLDRIQDFLSGLSGVASGPVSETFDSNDPRLAAAALMHHVIKADGVLRPEENEKLQALLTEEYSLDEQRLDALIAEAEAADNEAIDLYRFTSVLMRHLEREQCVAFVELLWELVYADGHRHELEDNVVWRVSELLGVSGRERVLMRQRVQKRAGIGDSDDSQD